MLLLYIGSGTSLTAQNISLTDINKIKSSNPSNYQSDNGVLFAVLNGVFYFTADDGIHGRELFASDGTANGTHLVKDINPGPASSIFAFTMTSGGNLYLFPIIQITVKPFGFRMAQMRALYQLQIYLRPTTDFFLI